jgi:hypothetical protein
VSDLQGAAQHREAIERRHLQIGEHDVEGLDQQPRQRHLAALGLGDVVARLPQDQRRGGAHVPLVVDDQDARPRLGRAGDRRRGRLGHGSQLP